MSDLNNIVQVTISRETQSIARASFGIPAIISEFSTAKTNTTFDRYRYYASLTEMTDDGWLTTDLEYKAAQIIFSQNPKVEKIMIGRKDSGDADFGAALAAIQIAQQEWYVFTIIATKTAKVVFDIDFESGNNIDFVINGTTVTTVPWNTNQATTMADIETQIEADIANSSVTVDPGDPNTRTLLIDITDGTASSITVVVTGGGNQAVGTISYDDTDVEDAYKDAAAWAETETKLFFFASSEADIITSATTDIASFMEGQNYDRTVTIYHTDTNLEQDPSWIEEGWPGEALPYDAGSQTWAYKTIAAVASYNLSSSELGFAFGKNANIYTSVAGVDIMREGKVASGEWIDIIRGLDWLKARLQEEIYSQLVNVRKIPYTDEGVTLIANIVEGVLNEAAGVGLLVKESIEVTAPKVADIASQDKIDRLLPDVEFTATLQGAIHKVEIDGVVTV